MNVAGAINPLLLSWVEAGVVSLPAIGKQPLQLSCVKLPGGSASDLLDSDRKESCD
jgi:hypothetical protein